MMLNLTFSHSDLSGACCLDLPAVVFSRRLSSAALAMGIALLLTSAWSVGAIIQRNHVTIGLVILNWVLLADAIIVLVIGTIVWFYTLRERAEYHAIYAKLQPSQRITIQDTVNHYDITPQSAFLTHLSTATSSAAADISTHRISLSSAETIARTQPSLIHSTRPF